MIEIRELNFEYIEWLITFTVGLYLILSFVYMIISSCIICYRKPTISLIDRYGKGTWALVTGASKGIGLEYSRLLAKEGFNIIMSARSHSLMEKYAKEIENEYKVRVKVITLDASSKESINELMKNIEDDDISIFVNNAGITRKGKFVDTPMKNCESIFDVNLNAPVSFFKLFQKKVSQRKGRSAFILVSSLSAECPGAYSNIYSVTKSFVSRYFEKVEHNSNIDILVVEYGLVSSEMVRARPIPGLIVSAESAVKCALRSLGRRNQTYGTFEHYMTHWFLTKDIIFISFREFNKMLAKKEEVERKIESEKKKTQ